MIQSMTGFSRQQIKGDFGNLICEMRSVNQRYLEISIKLPENFRELEVSLRELLRSQIQRGKVECFIRWESENLSNILKINLPVLQKLKSVLDEAKTVVGKEMFLDGMKLLQWPDILLQNNIDNGEFKEKITHIFRIALEALVKMREREGGNLQQVILKRLFHLEEEINKVREQAFHSLSHFHEQFKKKMIELKAHIAPERLEQEIFLLAQKVDISEEIDRLTLHVAEIKRILIQGGAVGRRLDFLVQELHREANTLAVKSFDIQTTQSSVEMRVLIDQMREQVQNLE